MVRKKEENIITMDIKVKKKTQIKIDNFIEKLSKIKKDNNNGSNVPRTT